MVTTKEVKQGKEREFPRLLPVETLGVSLAWLCPYLDELESRRELRKELGQVFVRGARQLWSEVGPSDSRQRRAIKSDPSKYIETLARLINWQIKDRKSIIVAEAVANLGESFPSALNLYLARRNPSKDELGVIAQACGEAGANNVRKLVDAVFENEKVEILMSEVEKRYPIASLIKKAKPEGS